MKADKKLYKTRDIGKERLLRVKVKIAIRHHEKMSEKTGI